MKEEKTQFLLVQNGQSIVENSVILRIFTEFLQCNAFLTKNLLSRVVYTIKYYCTFRLLTEFSHYMFD